MAYSASFSPDYYERIKSGKEAHPSSASVASCEISPLSLEKTFSERMQELMAEKGMTGPDVYKNADVGKDVFSRILSRKDYPLSKETAVSIALALRLSPDDADDLLERAGFSLSRSLLRDRALRYCFEEKIYNIVRVNILLDDLHCRLLTRSRY